MNNGDYNYKLGALSQNENKSHYYNIELQKLKQLQ